MTLSSMTGFARVQGQWETYHWTWEIRSVNSRGLDIRCRLPNGFEVLDQTVRNLVKKHIARGSLNVNLQMQRDSADVQVEINQQALDQLVDIVMETSAKHHLPQPDIAALLTVRDVVRIVDGTEDEAHLKERDQALEASLGEALEALKDSRRGEGRATAEMLTKILDEIEAQVKAANRLAADLPAVIRDKFLEKVNALLEDNKGFDADRIAQEVTILATKADVKEELDRLEAHLKAARKHVQQDGPVGRKLDFLTQEFNREANTLCSKSPDIRLTEIGLALKAAIDQLREQVQNVE
ncbi:YicC/YloC family endoribonuclease [Luteithermobacter gelatinilyticus]|uniref:YicC/YloC family endoribonuclease n=1 Tax=Luteithermobacter gelatinilyticus TaxID=2582913 RepID=UPI001106BC6C|nr:YicC/YloC family endoribonuclease [Luteithermobacter gelatinilyticus]